jgi:hypothetical protein
MTSPNLKTQLGGSSCLHTWNYNLWFNENKILTTNQNLVLLKTTSYVKNTHPHTIGIGISMASNFKGMVQRHIYLLVKVVCLSCQELQTMTPALCSWYCWKALNEHKVHWGDLVVFRPTNVKVIEYWTILWKKMHKMKTKYFKEIRESFWYPWKAFDEWDILEVISSFLDLRWGRYWILKK